MNIKDQVINHVVFVVDRSLSMTHHASSVIKSVDNEIKYLAQRSQELNQETRVSVYIFNHNVECVIYDMDVLRLPSIAEFYRAGGNTALIGATLKSLDDLAKIPELYSNHAFLEYVWTDGEENQARHLAPELARRIKALPNNWTMACFVPNQRAVFNAKTYGFPAQNIAVWDTDSVVGFEESTKVVRTATEDFMQARSTGTFRGTTSLFSMGADTLNKQTVTANLRELDPSQYMLVPVLPKYHRVEIPDFMRENGLQFKLGKVYYQLAKREEIQPQKEILVYENNTKKVYTGKEARRVVKLPDTKTRISPQDNPDYTVFIQSTAPNRKLDAYTKDVKNTQLLIMK